MNLFGILVVSLLKYQLVLGHMLMKSPPPRGYKNNPSYPAIDYDLNGPLPSLVMKNKILNISSTNDGLDLCR